MPLTLIGTDQKTCTKAFLGSFRTQEYCLLSHLWNENDQDDFNSTSLEYEGAEVQWDTNVLARTSETGHKVLARTSWSHLRRLAQDVLARTYKGAEVESDINV